jgi:hypothetical protein
MSNAYNSFWEFLTLKRGAISVYLWLPGVGRRNREAKERKSSLQGFNQEQLA